MERNFSKFIENSYDLLVIGGGVYGISCAREAALRGLKVGVIEKNDFGGQTSSNSAKIAHCGMRYLQHLDMPRMRESIRERNNMHQLAPQFVRSQPFLMPIYGHGIKGREVMTIYMKMYDLLSPERKQFKDDFRKVPDSKIISKEETIKLFPDVEQKGLTGGVVWYEGQMQNTERLTLSILKDASVHGAEFINYVEVNSIQVSNGTVSGVEVSDLISGESSLIETKHVINAAGPWSNKIFDMTDHSIKDHGIYASKAFSLFTRSVSDEYAITFPIRPMYDDKMAVVDKKSSLQFAIPWRGQSMFASLHLPCDEDPEKVTITEEEMVTYIERINEGYPNANLTMADVNHVLWGIVPADSKGSAAPMKHYKIIDHKKEDGLEGMTTVVGVKFTTARDVAVKTLKAIEPYLKIPKDKSGTETIPFTGGNIEFYEPFVEKTVKEYKDIFSEELTVRLIETYGTDVKEIASLVKLNPDLNEFIPGTDIIKAQIVFAIQSEMAQRLADIIFRRTDVGSLQHPGVYVLNSIAAFMAKELEWDQDRIAKEIDHTNSCYLVINDGNN